MLFEVSFYWMELMGYWEGNFFILFFCKCFIEVVIDFKFYWKYCKGFYDFVFLSRFIIDDRYKVGWVEYWKVWVIC